MRKITFFGFIALLLFSAIPERAHAIPPPDVITNIGSSFIQIFSLLLVFLSLGSSLALQLVRRAHGFAKQRKATVLVAGICIVAFALTGAYAWSAIKKEQSDKEIAKRLQEAIEKYDTGEIIETSAFFNANESLPLEIANDEFRAVESSAYVLDAREDEEYDIGQYPGSTHIRFADILAGAWRALPTDRVVYVFCWSGIRGSEVVKFLREKGVLAQALEEGANGWVEAGGTWDGEIAFSHVYSAPQYARLLTTDEVKAQQEKGAMLIDVRPQETGAPIAGSMALSAIYTPSEELAARIAQVIPGTQVITVCDDFVSCFDAKIVGIKLEKQGAAFLGRYAAPWEY